MNNLVSHTVESLPRPLSVVDNNAPICTLVYSVRKG